MDLSNFLIKSAKRECYFESEQTVKKHKDEVLEIIHTKSTQLSNTTKTYDIHNIQPSQIEDEINKVSSPKEEVIVNSFHTIPTSTYSSQECNGKTICDTSTSEDIYSSEQESIHSIQDQETDYINDTDTNPTDSTTPKELVNKIEEIYQNWKKILRSQKNNLNYSSDDTESVCSIQDQETEYVRDTDDTESDTEINKLRLEEIIRKMESTKDCNNSKRFGLMDDEVASSEGETITYVLPKCEDVNHQEMTIIKEKDLAAYNKSSCIYVLSDEKNRENTEVKINCSDTESITYYLPDYEDTTQSNIQRRNKDKQCVTYSLPDSNQDTWKYMNKDDNDQESVTYTLPDFNEGKHFYRTILLNFGNVDNEETMKINRNSKELDIHQPEHVEVFSLNFGDVQTGVSENARGDHKGVDINELEYMTYVPPDITINKENIKDANKTDFKENVKIILTEFEGKEINKKTLDIHKIKDLKKIKSEEVTNNERIGYKEEDINGFKCKRYVLPSFEDLIHKRIQNMDEKNEDCKESRFSVPKFEGVGTNSYQSDLRGSNQVVSESTPSKYSNILRSVGDFSQKSFISTNSGRKSGYPRSQSSVVSHRKPKLCFMCKTETTYKNLTFCTACYRVRKNKYNPRKTKLNSRPKLFKSEISFLSDMPHKNVITGENQHGRTESINSSEFETNKKSFDISNKEWSSIPSIEQKCITCNIRPKNGIFLHSTSGHMCFCYQCAVKYWNKSKRCACCNGIIKNVIKAYVV